MRLTDCFSSLVAYVTYFLKSQGKKQLSFAQLQADVQRLLSESESCLQGQHFSQEDFNQARFAICAWIDEAILSSSWEGRTEWQKEQLQRTYYQTTDAGQEFFERLNVLGLQQRDVREVYYLCLAMGFKGQYCHEGDDYLLDQLKTSNLKLLTGSSIGIPSLNKSELFPGAYPAETGMESHGKKGFQFSPFTLLFLAGPVALYGILFVVYRFILNNIGENFLSTTL